jgi:hypothetical protein
MRLNQCDCCGRKFGLVSHSLWNRRFCSKLCLKVYQADNSRLPIWAALIACKADRGLDRIMSMVPRRRWAGQTESAGS